MSRFQSLLSFFSRKNSLGRVFIPPPTPHIKLKSSLFLVELNSFFTTRTYCSSVQVKPQFVQKENIHSRQYLLNNPAYNNVMFKPELIPKLDQLHAVTQKFIEISNGSDLQDLNSSSYHDIIVEIENNLGSMSYDDILSIIWAMSKFPYTTTHPNDSSTNFYKLWKAIDDECLVRFHSLKWTRNESFVVDDALFPLLLSKHMLFSWNLVKKSFRKCDKLTKEQFIRFLFSIVQRRNLPPAINTYELEYNLERHVDQIDVHEFTVAAMAFFKTKTPIRGYILLNKVLEKATKSVDQLDSISAAAIAKCIRLSSINGSEGHLLNFLSAATPHIDRLSVPASVHLALVGTQTGIVNYELVKKVLAKVEANLGETRLKEMERILLVAAMFNIPCTSLQEKILEEIRSPRRADELHQHGRSLPSLVYHLSVCQIYPMDLIDKVLSEPYLRKNYGKNMQNYQREIVALDITVGLEIPKSQYTGSRLTERLRTYLMKYQTFRTSKEREGRISVFEGNLLQIGSVLKDIYKKTADPVVLSILPHYYTIELLLCTDREGNAVKIPEYIQKYEAFQLKLIPPEEQDGPVLYHAFILVSRQNIIYGSKEPNGNTVMRERQLKKLGYIVHRVYQTDWANMKDPDRETLLKNYISKGIANAAEPLVQKVEFHV